MGTANYSFLNYLVLVLGILLLDDEAIEWCLRRLKPRATWTTVRTAQTPPSEETPDSWRAWVEAAALGWIFYATVWAFFAPGSRGPLAFPERALEPFRIANAYGLFANMTPARYE